MFLRFTPLAAIRDFRRRACQVRRLRQGRLPGDRTRRQFRLEGLEERCLLSGVAITEFSLPTGAGGSMGIVAGPNGNLWFTDKNANAIGEINPTTHAITEFAIPTADCWPYGIAVGSDGNLWFTEAFSSKIGRITPAGKITQFAAPYPDSRGITAGPDGNLWFTEVNGNAIGMINPTTHAISEFALPDNNAWPWGITAGADGNIWFTELHYGVGMINPTTHAITEFSTPTPGSTPVGITAGPDGNLWFTDNSNSAIGVINATTHVISEFAIPTANADPNVITSGPDGNLWFTEPGAGKIGTISPTTYAITEYPVPYANADPLGITTGPDENLWFTDNGTDAIGVATLASTQFMVTVQPPSSVTAGSQFGLTVEDMDSSGNPITSFDGTVTVALASNPGGATLGGTLSVTASGGVANFSGLTLNKAASGYTLVMTSSGIGEGVTNAMTVTPAAPTQLVITQQPPASVGVNSAFGLQASVEDQYGNVVTTATNTVNVAFASNPTGATLGGTLSVTASQGVAIFSNLTINKTGTSYTLQVSSSGLSSAVSSAISVTKKGGAAIVSNTNVANPSDLLLAPLVSDSQDLFAGLGLKKRNRST